MDHAQWERTWFLSAAMVCFLFIVTVFITFLVFQCRKPKKTQQALKPESTTELSSITIDDSVSVDPTLQFSITELRVATNDFSSDLIIGDSSFGLVYKGRLSNGVTVAIKKLDPGAFKGSREFCTEMVTLGMLCHPNIVKILGYCMTGSDKLLIYEFIQKGSLDLWLHQEQNVATPRFGHWRTRIQIVRGVANGLSYLHGLDIVHRDIKSSNVLLDSDFQACVSGFAIARRINGSTSTSHVSSQSAGSVGYMPPEHKEGLTAATLEADVYSFGILMLEIGSGKRPYLPTLWDGKEVGLVQWARKMLAQCQQMEMVDASISREDGLIDAHVKEYFEIAGMCTSEIRKERPTMAEVFQLLNQISI